MTAPSPSQHSSAWLVACLGHTQRWRRRHKKTTRVHLCLTFWLFRGLPKGWATILPDWVLTELVQSGCLGQVVVLKARESEGSLLQHQRAYGVPDRREKAPNLLLHPQQGDRRVGKCPVLQFFRYPLTGTGICFAYFGRVQGAGILWMPRATENKESRKTCSLQQNLLYPDTR